ncbi:MAG TPA: hypothetical protein VGJ60_30905 [Chloroflexota bacterium]|jgi:hypothetical protein
MASAQPGGSKWYETSDGRARLLLEKQIMAARFPDFQLSLIHSPALGPGSRLGWQGTLTTPRGNRYVVHVIYPEAFPDEPARVYPIQPSIKLVDKDGVRLVHQYSDGRMCLFDPNERTFTPSTSAATVTAVAAAWLFCYEHWTASGGREWPGKAADMSELALLNSE